MRRMSLAILALLLLSTGSYAQVTYTESVLATNEFDFNLTDLTVDGNGLIWYYNEARYIENVTKEGVVTRVSGQGGTVIRSIIPPEPTTGFVASEVALQSPGGLVADGMGNLFFYQDGLILKIDVNDTSIYRVAGRGAFGTAFVDGADGFETALSFSGPMAIGPDGLIYFGIYPVPANPHILRQNSDGTLTLIGGGNGRGTEGVGGSATAAQIGNGHFDGLTVDPLGNVFLADDRVLFRIGTDGILTIIHDGGSGVADVTFSGQDISTVSIGAFNSIAAGPDGSLFFEADKSIHQLSPDGTVTTILEGNDVGDIAVDSDGNIYFANNDNTGAGAADHTIRMLTRSTPFTGTPQAVGGAATGGGDGTSGGGDGTAGGGDGSGDGSGDDGTTVVLPEGEVGPAGLDLDTANGDQGVHQTEENPAAGDEVTVDIFITEGATGNSGFQATVAWDPTELSFVSFSAADVFGSGLNLPNETDSTYTAAVAILGGTASKDAGSVGRVTFEVLEGFDGETTVTLTDLSVGNTSSETDLVVGDGAAFVVIGGVQTTTPDKATVAGSDFSGDGMVDFSDFLTFASAFGSSSSDAGFDTRIDLNDDGKVDFSDFLTFASFFGQATGG